MKISIIGAGYVGLVSGICLADKGNQVVCVDVDRGKVDKINKGEAPIHEDGLGALLTKHVGKNFRASADLHEAVLQTELTMIAVGTPFDGRDIDLGYIRQASQDIGEALAEKPDYHVVVVKSTVVPGTTEGVVRETLERASGKSAGDDFGLGMNPEFLTEGVAIRDFMNPDRIVLGGIDERTLDALRAVYAGFESTPILETNPSTAELIKYTSNALLATMISFSNEIAGLAAKVGGIDTSEVMHAVHLSEYLSLDVDGHRKKAKITSFLNPGCGFGGSCLPKDTKALAAQGESLGAPMRLLEQVIEVNLGQPQKMLELLRQFLPDLEGKTVGVLGLAFKEGTDDMRESPAVPIVEALASCGARVVVFDPVAMPAAQPLLPDDTTYAEDLASVIGTADALLLVTRWDEFLELPSLMRELGREDVPLVDGRRFIDKHAIRNYSGIGL